MKAKLEAKQSSTELMRRCFYGNAVTISGRLRGQAPIKPLPISVQSS